MEGLILHHPHSGSLRHAATPPASVTVQIGTASSLLRMPLFPPPHASSPPCPRPHLTRTYLHLFAALGHALFELQRRGLRLGGRRRLARRHTLRRREDGTRSRLRAKLGHRHALSRLVGGSLPTGDACYRGVMAGQ